MLVIQTYKYVTYNSYVFTIESVNNAYILLTFQSQ